MQNKKSIKGVVPTLSDVTAIHSKNLCMKMRQSLAVESRIFDLQSV